MDQPQNKLRVLLLRAPIEPDDAAGTSAHWARISKSLGVFTDYRELERAQLEPTELDQLTSDFDHVFLDSMLAPWDELEKRARPRLTLVSTTGAEWISVNATRPALSRHPFLLLEGIGASDLLRVLHLFLLPKRLAGVTPVMEKGSLILAEKVMDSHNLGALLDRLAAYLGQIEGNELTHRINDLRQVLSAMLFEGLECAKHSESIYPSIDFQAAASKSKLAVNLRFPRGHLAADRLQSQILHGMNLFWHQAWQCSDLMLLSYHKKSDELEVTLLLCQPERSSASQLRTLLFKISDQQPGKENLLEPPQNYTFKLISEIRPKASDYVVVASESFEEVANGIDFSTLPEKVANGFHQLKEHCLSLSKQLNSKEFILKEALGGTQAAQRELTHKRSELIQTMKANDLHSHAQDSRIADLEAKLDQQKRPGKDGSGKGAQESGGRLETMLRLAENEKVGLRDAIAFEQKRVASIEQKYSALFKDISIKDREINDLKTTLMKTKKEHSLKKTGKPDTIEVPEDISFQLKQAEQREIFYKQELFAAKAKQVELLKRISELVAAMKKSGKAA